MEWDVSLERDVPLERDVSLESILLSTGDMICGVRRMARLSIKSAGVTPVDVFSTVFMMSSQQCSNDHLSWTRLSKSRARKCRSTS